MLEGREIPNVGLTAGLGLVLFPCEIRAIVTQAGEPTTMRIGEPGLFPELSAALA